MSPRGRHALALAASLLLHGAVLGALALRRGEAVRQAPVVSSPAAGELVAVQVLGPVEEGAPAAGLGPGAGVPRPAGGAVRRLGERAASAAAERAAAPAGEAAAVEPAAAAEPAAAEAPAASGEAPAEPAEAQGPAAAVGTVAGDSAPGGAGAGREGVGSVADGPGGVSATRGMAGVPAALLARLEEAARRCYPPAARRFLLRGEASVRFCASASGAAVDVALVRTSGAGLLDTAALRCVVPGAEPLPVTGGCFQVPVRFDMAR